MKQSKQDIFTDLYQLHSSHMYAICLRYTRNTEDAEDVLQEGFMKIFHAFEGFKGESNIKTWMQRIMVNTAINHYRQKKKMDFTSIDKDGSVVLRIDNNDAINKMSTDELLEVINELPNGYRMVFNLYVIEGYKHKEIAEMLEITEGTSKSQLAKARNAIQVLIADKLGITKENLQFTTINNG